MAPASGFRPPFSRLTNHEPRTTNYWVRLTRTRLFLEEMFMRNLRRPIQSLWVIGGVAISVWGSTVSVAAQATGGQVVVRAVTREGRPVTDLKPGDLSLRIDGKPREIKGLELVEPKAAATPGDWGSRTSGSSPGDRGARRRDGCRRDPTARTRGESSRPS